jgi:glycerol-3-phosphate dehydrogenase
MAYREDFVQGAQACRIPITELSAKEALRIEPNLNPKLLTAFTVPDGTFDPLRLALSFAASAQQHRAKFMLYTEVTGLLVDGRRCVTGVSYWDRRSDTRGELRADVVVSATGSWAGQVAKMADIEVPVKPTPGVMVAFENRFTERAINRLNIPGDGDIALPQRRMVVVGTTSFEVKDLDYIPVIEAQVKEMVERGSELIPGIRNSKMRGAFMSSRPLIGAGASARSMARTFKCFDHADTDSMDGFVTISGGKATTCRAMAERTADIVCKKLSVSSPCTTRQIPLSSYRDFHYD